MSINRVEAFYQGESGGRYFEYRRQRKRASAQFHSAQQFRPYVLAEDTVLDFGCGTGALLSHLECARRIGIDVNEPSLAVAQASGIEAYRSLSEIEGETVDVVISHHALEHVAEPFQIISEFHRVLKTGGKLVIIVPCEPGRRRHFRSWREQLDVHLYSWNPLSLGNLVATCGFTVEDAAVRTGGFSKLNEWMLPVPPAFAVAEKLTAHVLGRFNTMCVGYKPMPSA